MDTKEKKARYNGVHIITNGQVFSYQFDQSEIPEYLIYDYKKWFRFIPQIPFTDAALRQWITDYQFFLDSKPNLRALLLAKGIEYAEICLRHCQQHEPTDLHQINNFERRIDAAKKMAAIGKSKEVIKEPSPLTTKRELTDLTAVAIALIHVFTEDPITMENRDKIATRYKKPNGQPYSPAKLYNEFLLIATEKEERLRRKPTKTLLNHYIRCINWLKSKGLKTAQKAAISELKDLQAKQVNV